MVIAAAGPAKGRTIAILTIHEFETVPVLCGTQVRSPGGAEIVRKGACYVRSNQVPATTEAADHAHLRELLDLAVEKGVREFLRRARGARSTNRFGRGNLRGPKISQFAAQVVKRGVFLKLSRNEPSKPLS